MSNEHASQGSLIELAEKILRHRRAIIAAPAFAVVLTVVLLLVLPKKYTTVVSFTPVAGDLPAGNLASLAGQFGIGLPLGDASSSPDFYAELLQTPDVLTAIANTRYKVADGRDTLTGTFAELYDIDKGTPGKTLDEVLRVLRTEVMSVTFGRQTSIVRTEVKTKWPELSYAISRQLIAVVNGFNVTSRQTNGGAQRDFLRQRLDTARSELRSAEADLQQFLIANRSYENDPRLQFQHDRLLLEFNMRQDIATTLTQGYEQARLSAVKNTPSISLVEAPKYPLRFDRRNILIKAIVAGAIGALAGIFWALVAEAVAEARLQDPARFEALTSGLRSIFRPSKA